MNLLIDFSKTENFIKIHTDLYLKFKCQYVEFLFIATFNNRLKDEMVSFEKIP